MAAMIALLLSMAACSGTGDDIEYAQEEQAASSLEDYVDATPDESLADESVTNAVKDIEPCYDDTSISESSNSPVTRELTIAIDPGHQAKGNSSTEPIGPGSSDRKAKVTSGTRGVATNVPEYQLNLDVSIKLRDELVSRGYNVILIRETHDVDISNKERAEIATEAEADIFIRIHADGSENQSVNGILTMCPSKSNPYVPHLHRQSRLLADEILTAMVASTGAKNRGVLEADNMSGINWSTMPVVIIEMGLMTNPEEDRLMQTDEYQMKLVKGIVDGINQYFLMNDGFGE
jgi:N-acetylmuramoyl-L-alanine amidase